VFAVRFQRDAFWGSSFTRGGCPWLGLRGAFGAECDCVFGVAGVRNWRDICGEGQTPCFAPQRLRERRC